MTLAPRMPMSQPPSESAGKLDEEQQRLANALVSRGLLTPDELNSCKRADGQGAKALSARAWSKAAS